MVQWYEVSFFALEEVGVQVHIPGGYFLCFFIVFLPFGLFLFILTAFSFARFLR